MNPDWMDGVIAHHREALDCLEQIPIIRGRILRR
jgi:hypothetical protein